MSEQRPQLRMRRALRDLPKLALPAGYTLRCFGPDDVERWVDLLNANGELQTWTAEHAAPYFAPDSTMPLAGSFFVEQDGVAVATAQLHLHPSGPFAPLPELGWVAAHPAHRGRGVGSAVCLAVLHHAQQDEHQQIFLRTDDHRLPAIRTYLRLGFRPWPQDSDTAARWEAIRMTLRLVDKHLG